MERPTPPNSTDLHINAPPYTSAQPNSPSTPRPASHADGSDTEYDPTPLHSPGGPQYDDLPPSYNDALTDARNGVTPLDPSQLEAHRLTLNEGPNEPEVWEYRVRAEGQEDDDAPELAPEYGSHVNDLSSTVPVQHVANSENILVGQVRASNIPSDAGNSQLTILLNRALEFTRHEPDVDANSVPRLPRCVAIPQDNFRGANSTHEPLQVLRSYATILHAHSIRPAEFVEFLDGLNTLCNATKTSSTQLLHSASSSDLPSSIVQDYMRGANEAFFAPRGLRVTLRSLSDLLHVLEVPTQKGQRPGAIETILDTATTATQTKAQALYPWVEPLETNVPSPSTHTQALCGSGQQIRSHTHAQDNASSGTANPNSLASPRNVEDPPHSVPESTAYPHHPYASNNNIWNTSHHVISGRAESQDISQAPAGPFGRQGHGLFGPPGHGPFGRPGNGPFGPPGAGPFGRDSLGRRPGRGRGRGRGRGSFGQRSGGSASGPSAQQDWQAFGENIGKMGEEFGRRMGDWGQQLGVQAAAWGQEVGRTAAYAGSSGSAGRSQPPQYDQAPHYDQAPRYDQVPRYDQARQTGQPPHYDRAPPYAGPASQETGVHDGDIKDHATSADYKVTEKKACEDGNDDDDDASSISSFSSDSSDSSDSETEDPDEQSKRAIQRAFKQRRRELTREYRQKKQEMRSAHGGKGKDKGKATKSKEWKETKREYRAKRKELKRERAEARRAWKQARREGKKTSTCEGKKGSTRDAGPGGEDAALHEMVWVVIENLDS
jgi:hypothetical protein